ncbi:hypothetical protein ACOMHN_050307 [Nucella lapillus]
MLWTFVSLNNKRSQTEEIVLLVTQDFVEDDVSGHSVLHAQGCLIDAPPRRVLLLYLGPLSPGPGPRGLPTRLSMRRLLRMLPESQVYDVQARTSAPRVAPLGRLHRGGVGYIDHEIQEE